MYLSLLEQQSRVHGELSPEVCGTMEALAFISYSAESKLSSANTGTSILRRLDEAEERYRALLDRQRAVYGQR
jgi:hypothetical protein